MQTEQAIKNTNWADKIQIVDIKDFVTKVANKTNHPVITNADVNRDVDVDGVNKA